VTAGASTTASVGGQTYTITVVGVSSDGNMATIDIDGDAFDVSPPTCSGGTCYDSYVTSGDLNVYIKSVRAFEFPAKSGAVQFFVGSEKLELSNTTNQITKGTTILDGATVEFTSVTGDKIYELQIKYIADEEQYLRAGEGFEDPVFGAFKIKLGGISPELDDDTKDLIEIQKSSTTRVKLKFKNKIGDECSMDVMNLTTSGGAAGTAWWAYGTKPIKVINMNETNPLATGSDPIEKGEYFLVSKNKNSYILKYVSSDSTNQLIRLQDVCSASTFDISEQTGFFYLGSDRYTFSSDVDNDILAVNATDHNGGVGQGQVPLFTKNGAMITLKSAEPGNLTIEESTFSESGHTDLTPDQIEIEIDYDTTEVDGISVDPANLQGGLLGKDDTDYYYGVTQAGTYVMQEAVADWVKMYTPKLPSPVFVAVGTDPILSTSGSTTTGTVEEAVKIKNPVGKLVSEIDKTAVDRDLVLIGGPCANSLVADLLEMSSSKPQCSADFTALYPSEGVITVVSDAFGSGKKALIVAGVDRAKTRDLGSKVMRGTLDYSA
jgi:hypothetical protein